MTGAMRTVGGGTAGTADGAAVLATAAYEKGAASGGNGGDDSDSNGGGGNMLAEERARLRLRIRNARLVTPDAFVDARDPRSEPAYALIASQKKQGARE